MLALRLCGGTDALALLASDHFRRLDDVALGRLERKSDIISLDCVLGDSCLADLAQIRFFLRRHCGAHA